MKFEINPYIVAIIALVLLCLLLGFRGCGSTPDTPKPIVLHDTVTITKHDTLTRSVTKYITVKDTFYVLVTDSVRDTVYLPSLPIEHKEFIFAGRSDSIRYSGSVLYHGFAADIDTVGLSFDLHYTPDPPKPRRTGQFLGIGIGAGVSAGYDPMRGTVGAMICPLQLSVVYGWGVYIPTKR